MNREEAIKRIRDFGLYHAIEDLPRSTKTVEAFKMAIQALEEPERKKGKWIENLEYLPITYTCPFCGHEIWYDATNFCDQCGADMREETEK